jgi:hypothetical protein
MNKFARVEMLEGQKKTFPGHEPAGKQGNSFTVSC